MWGSTVSEELGGVAAARAHVEHVHAGTHADEGQHVHGMAALVVGAIGGAALRARHELRELLARERLRGARSDDH